MNDNKYVNMLSSDSSSEDGADDDDGKTDFMLSIYLHGYIIIYFTIFYTMIHNVNYSIFHVNKIHECHHHNETTNIGPDIMDIVFGTKYDINDIENTDHYIFPIIIASIISYILKYNWEIINNKKTCLYLFSFLFSLISIIVFTISIYLFFNL